jgi:CarD family transcriptional regulator
MKNVETIGLRGVVDEGTVQEVLHLMRSQKESDTTNWNRRYRANLDKMKSGDIYEVADVVRSLMLRDDEKGLSTGERKMLDNAKQILISELVLVKGMKEEQAFELIDDIYTETE